MGFFFPGFGWSRKDLPHKLLGCVVFSTFAVARMFPDMFEFKIGERLPCVNEIVEQSGDDGADGDVCRPKSRISPGRQEWVFVPLHR